MWLLVYCRETGTYSVISRANQCTDEIKVGSVIDVVHSAEVVFMNPNRAICERHCTALKKNPSLYKAGRLRPQSPQPESAKEDTIEPKVDKIIAYLLNFELRLQKLANHHQKLDRDLTTLLNRVRPDIETSSANGFPDPTPTPPSLPRPKLDVRDRTLELPNLQNAVNYPYHLSRESIAEIHRSKQSATAFARAVERELFLNDADRDQNLDKRADQEKVRWLRELVREYYPSPTSNAEALLWSACQIAVNDYHRKRRSSAKRMMKKNALMRERFARSRSLDESQSQPPAKLTRTEVESPTCVQIHGEDFDDVKEVHATDLL